MTNTHLVIPDTQLRDGDDTGFLVALGKYIVRKQPDTVIMLGDWADMPSLSSYDVGKKVFEGRRYIKDVEAAIAAQEALWSPLVEFNKQTKSQQAETIQTT